MSAGSVGPPPPLDYQERSLLEVLYERGKPGVYHKRELEHAPFEEVAQDAGLGTVGEASTMTRPAMEFRRLEDRGLVERVKVPGEALRYRVTQLGERTILTGRIERLEKAGENLAHDLHDRKAQVRALEGQLSIAVSELLAWKKLPWWRRAFGHPGAAESLREQSLNEEVYRD